MIPSVHRLHLYCICIIMLWMQNPVAFAQTSDSLTLDSIVAPPSTRKARVAQKFVVPAGLALYGVATIGDRRYFSSIDVYNYMQRTLPGAHTRADDITFAVPIMAVYGLNAAGVKGKNGFVDRSAMLVASIALANSISVPLKYNIGHLRPDSSARTSFPSGHTTNAFVSAEFMHQEYKHLSPWYSVGAYTMATATGVMRMVNNRHWLSDVLVGASIGMASTKVTYLVYPWVKNKLFPSKKPMQSLIMPYYNGQQGAGLVAVWRLNQ
jgi:membrane-associated phospholipid phosphatase